MKIHAVELAKAEMGKALINAAIKHELTDAETLLAITQVTNMMINRSL